MTRVYKSYMQHEPMHSNYHFMHRYKSADENVLEVEDNKIFFMDEDMNEIHVLHVKLSPYTDEIKLEDSFGLFEPGTKQYKAYK